MRLKSFIPSAPRAQVACLLTMATAIAGLPGRPAYAQAIVLSVNGDPITSIDVEQQMKLLRAMRRPSSREAAIASMISERLEAREASRFGIVIKDDEMSEEVQREAKKLKLSSTQLIQDLQRSGVSQERLKSHFKTELGYLVLIKALNRGVEASEIQVRQELAREKGKNSVTKYTIRQVVFTLNPGDGPAVVNASVKEAEALRGRFTNCATGIPYAKTLPGVAVRTKLTRTSSQLDDGIRQVLDKTPIGHLTQPSRSPNGIELIAVCDRSAEKNDDDLRKSISDRLLAEHIEQQADSKLKDLRAHAVIERR